jgi:hypothetical protein
MELFESIMRLINATLSEINVMFKNAFNTTQTNYIRSPENLEIRNSIGLIDPNNPSIKFIQTYTARIAGNETILFMGEVILFRCDSESEVNFVISAIKEILKPQIIIHLDKSLGN